MSRPHPPRASVQVQVPEHEAEPLLPMQPDAMRSFFTRHSGFINGAIVVCYLLGCALMLLLQTTDLADESVTLWWWIPSCAAVALALWYRPRYPMLGLVLTVALTLLDLGALNFANSVALVFFLYAIPIYQGVRAAWIGFTVATVGTVCASVASAWSSENAATWQGVFTTALTMIIGTSVWYIAVVVIGINVGNRRRYVSALVAHAEHLVREREQQDALAAAAERARIAREMHDIVAHSLSVVVTLTEAAAISMDRQPEAAKNALQRAGETGRSALAEMRLLLGVLGDTSAGVRAPQPQLADLPELCSGFEDAGLRITRIESGVALQDSGHQIAIYRIVQEALTNTLRYAGRGAEVVIDLAHTDHESRLTVTDTGAPAVSLNIPSSDTTRDSVPGSGERIPGSGRGLAGATQRVEMYGGSLHAGPHGSGWRVSATVPFPERGITVPGSGTPQTP